MLKAYQVQNDEGGQLVYAESPGRAKAYALGHCEWFEGSEFMDLRATRVKKADEYLCLVKGYPSGKYVRYDLDFCENAEIFHKIGWTCSTRWDCDEKECVLHGSNQEEEL